jgi:hypothetical protein
MKQLFILALAAMPLSAMSQSTFSNCCANIATLMVASILFIGKKVKK